MNDSPFMVTLYFRGDNLEPDVITKQLGVLPTDTRRKGEERHGKQGRVYTNRTGIWKLRAATVSNELSEHIEELTSKFKKEKIVSDIMCVEEAFIDVFLCYDRLGESDSYCFELTEENIRNISLLGVSVQFTVSSYKELEEM